MIEVMWKVNKFSFHGLFIGVIISQLYQGNWLEFIHMAAFELIDG